ncbi:MAG TPA: hypothetical protein VGR74_00265 [Actinomycetota bacterium]|jgi:hypothetical protein|nr:hypothetical protein [Actinomycetota bacterium]
MTTLAHVTQAKVARSEWTKFRTQPSAAWSLLTAVALIVGFGVLYSLVRVTRPPRTPAEMASFDPTAIGSPASSWHRSRLASWACSWSPASTPPA